MCCTIQKTLLIKYIYSNLPMHMQPHEKNTFLWSLMVFLILDNKHIQTKLIPFSKSTLIKVTFGRKLLLILLTLVVNIESYPISSNKRWASNKCRPSTVAPPIHTMEIYSMLTLTSK